jgi:signal peptidase I
MNGWLKGIGWVLGICAVIVAAGRAFLFVSWKIPDDPFLGTSLAPTLNAGDTVLVLTRGTPKFGDLVRCPDPEDPTNWVVGRIVGLPDDVVEVKPRSLRINNTRYNASDACTQPYFNIEHPANGTKVEMQCGRVEMGGGWHYRGQRRKELKSGKKKLKVPDGEIFLLSDNRDFHDDSRDFGTLPQDSCTQRLVFRVMGKGGWSDSESRMSFVH